MIIILHWSLAVSDISKGPGFLPTFLYYFSGTALVTTLLAVKTLDISLNTGAPNQLGLIAGLFGGLLGAYFNRSVTLEVPFKSKKSFLNTLNASLAEMGYEPRLNIEDVVVYQRPSLRRLLSGRVFVQIADNAAIISSRSIHIKGLKKRLG